MILNLWNRTPSATKEERDNVQKLNREEPNTTMQVDEGQTGRQRDKRHPGGSSLLRCCVASGQMFTYAESTVTSQITGTDVFEPLELQSTLRFSINSKTARFQYARTPDAMLGSYNKAKYEDIFAGDQPGLPCRSRTRPRILWRGQGCMCIHPR